MLAWQVLIGSQNEESVLGTQAFAGNKSFSVLVVLISAVRTVLEEQAPHIKCMGTIGIYLQYSTFTKFQRMIPKDL